jgi:hypothetical protein
VGAGEAGMGGARVDVCVMCACVFV